MRAAVPPSSAGSPPSGNHERLFKNAGLRRRPMRRGTLTIGARYVYPVEGPPIKDGCLTIDHGRIGWVGRSNERPSDLDLGNVAIVPGFVNAHTHLELAPLAKKGPAGRDPENEVSWLRHVIEQRRIGH